MYIHFNFKLVDCKYTQFYSNPILVLLFLDLHAILQFHDIACLPPSRLLSIYLSLCMLVVSLYVCIGMCLHFLLLGSLIFLVSMFKTLLLVRSSRVFVSYLTYCHCIVVLVVIIIANVEVEMAIALRLIVLMLDRGGGNLWLEIMAYPFVFRDGNDFQIGSQMPLSPITPC